MSKIPVKDVQIGDRVKTVPSADFKEVLDVEKGRKGEYTLYFHTGWFNAHGNTRVYKDGEEQKQPGQPQVEPGDTRSDKGQIG